MHAIIANIGTDEVKARLEASARAGGYHVREWLTPGHNGKGLRIVATMKIGGRTHGLACKWDGEDLNELAARCLGLDLAMSQLPDAVAQGRNAFWEDN